MGFYENLRSKVKLSESKLDLLPRSYVMLGKILLLKLKPELYKDRKKIGKAILEILPYAHSVCLQKDISGLTRTPEIEVIAGCKDTVTLHKEHGMSFFIDVSKLMWSKGNKNEKQRLLGIVKKSDVIVDMFAGIGYWSIFLGKKAKKIYAIDINPTAIEFLEKNIMMNHLESKIDVLEGDCKEFSHVLRGFADRIIMGYIYDTEKFLPYALEMCKPKAVIHFHRNVKDSEIEKIKKLISRICKKLGFSCSISENIVKSYSPHVYHMVFDISLRKI